MKTMTAKHWVIIAGLFATAAVAISGHDGWGWILFVTFLMMMS